MYKILTAIILSLSLLFLIKESVVTLRTSFTAPPSPAKEKKDKQRAGHRVEQPVSFYPSVPSPLPDLNTRYLFNEERFLADESEEKAEEGEDDEDALDLSVDFDTVFYSGSIIVGDVRKGLISYSPPKTLPAARTAPSRLTKGKNVTTARKKTKNYAQLVAGDSISGYKVEAIEPDRIVFKKGAETIEKLLADPKKVRIAPPLPAKKTVVKKVTATTTKQKRVQLDRARASARTGTRTNTPLSTRKVINRRPIPAGVKIQTPGVPPVD